MTTQEFIKRNYGIASDKDRKCSSVWADYDGNIYSYGRHYPLLFEVDGVNFINATGYSNTTAKHINWARQAEPGAIDIWLSGCNQYTWRNPENGAKAPHLLYLAHYGMTDDIKSGLKKAILADLEAERANIQERIDSKKRTDTAIYRSLVDEMQDCVKRLELVRGFWGIA